MNDIVCRPYAPDDRAACLSIFDSNVPTYFATSERADFRDYLDSTNSTDRPNLVLTRGGGVLACGGLIAPPDQRQARFAWGMVDRALHGRGLGTHLTRARLDMARAIPPITEVGLETSQHTHGFYAGFGFVITGITPDGLAPGLDRYDMVLRLA